MSMFPTAVALQISRNAKLHKLVLHEIIQDALCDFQKVAAVDTFENALIMFNAHVVKGELDEEQTNALKDIHAFTEIEVNGIILDRVGGILKNGKLEANSLAAATLLNVMRNGEDGGDAKGAVKKIIFELQKD